MKAAVYNPYLDTLGGGERYTMAFSKVLSDEGYKVDVEWKDREIKKKLEERFGFDLKEINFINDIKRGDGYEVCFWVTDGSIPLLRARKNFLHFQLPFKDVNGKSLLNKMKFFRISKIICNSHFTKRFVDGEYGVESIVLYPPVDLNAFKPKRKENLIIYVGRFSQLAQAKRQDVLIDAFKKMCQKRVGGWKLILAGGVDVGVGEFLLNIKKESLGFPIEIVESPNFRRLKGFYGEAKIFWSASGFGIDEKEEPEKVEHFGISVVEAMSAKAAPLVFSAGGHREIIKDEENGFLWESKSELINKTMNLINSPKRLHDISKRAQVDSVHFGYEKFREKVLELI